ncbi:unnamed protein product [Diabrotica balteata]|uniref:G-protein coupled receptors family 1 profile domain-containing protein n=1 Tax=Diabrotica balteata TaxID=107213 RepID=A0A9N9TBK4_DIABA|nr:unnamed protein product [Diabrotica balteata]
MDIRGDELPKIRQNSLTKGFTAETSANATVLTITAFTVERYVAICHPFLSHTLSKLNRAIKYIIFIWAVAMCLAVPQAMALGIVCEKFNGYVREDYCVCNVKRQVIPHAFEISFFVFFVAPMSLITILYIFIGLQLRKSTVGPSRGNSVKMRHRVYKPVVTYMHPSTQVIVMNRGGTVGEVVEQGEEEGRKNFARSAQATKHVVKMLEQNLQRACLAGGVGLSIDGSCESLVLGKFFLQRIVFS